MSLDWREFFPFERVRSEQERAIEFLIEEFIGNDKEFVVAELGTGVGKSAIAVTVARWLAANESHLREVGAVGDETPKAYVLTSQKVLQDQYVNDFPGLVADIRSSSNYGCSWLPQQTCAETRRVKDALKQRSLPVISCEGVCSYGKAKQAFKDATVGVTNYSFFLSETVYAGTLAQRELLVLDEAHNVEDEVRRWAAITIVEPEVRSLGLRLPRIGDDNGLKSWVELSYAPALAKAKARTLDLIERKLSVGGQMLRELTKRYELIDKHLCQVNRYVAEIGGDKDNYVASWSDGGRAASLRPLDVSRQARGFLYSKGRKKLLMTATVLDEKTFMRSAGVPANRASFISVPTPFPATSFGIKVIPVGQMSKKEAAATIPDLVKNVSKIISAHATQKGIIHTASYAVLESLESIKDNRLLFQKSASDRDKLIKQHIASKEPTVLVSPSLTEGLDLKGDLGRFQVVCKVPFPYLGDKVTMLRMKKDPAWYSWCTVRTLVQAVGRCVRSTDDWTSTYILDACFIDLLLKQHKLFPPHFESLEIEDP